MIDLRGGQCFDDAVRDGMACWRMQKARSFDYLGMASTRAPPLRSSAADVMGASSGLDACDPPPAWLPVHMHLILLVCVVSYWQFPTEKCSLIWQLVEATGQHQDMQ